MPTSPHRLALLLVLAATPSLAQPDPASTAQAAAANQLGILEYCQAGGHVSEDVVVAQRDTISRLPPSAVSQAEPQMMGKQGRMLVPNGPPQSLDAVARAHGSTVDATCKEMGRATLAAVAAYKQQGITGAITPATPGALPLASQPMDAAPTPVMPGGMPAMGMPVMPGATPAR